MQACARGFEPPCGPGATVSPLFSLRIAMMRQLLDVVHQAIQRPLRIDLGLRAQVNRLSSLLCRRLANTGSTVAMRWLYSRLPLELSMACFMRSVN
jgi:hypothetical protein